MAYQSFEEVLRSLEMVLEELKNKIPSTGITHATGSIPVTLAPDGATNQKLNTIYDFLNNAQLKVGVNNFPTNLAINNLTGLATDSSLGQIRDLLAGTIKVSSTSGLPVIISNLPLPENAASNTVQIQVRDKIPAIPLGPTTPANSISVTLSPTGALVSSFGLTTDVAATSDIESTSFLSLFKYFLKRFSLFLDGIEVSGTASTLNGIAIPSTDVRAYTNATIQVITSTGFLGTIVIQGSNDAATWHNLAFEDLSNTPNTRVASATASGLYYLARLPKFIRVTLSALTVGSITARMIAKK